MQVRILAYLVVLLLFSSHCVMGQSVKFYEHYYSSSEITLRSIDTAYNEGYITVGRQRNVNGSDFLLIKLDSLGNEEWRKVNVMFTGFDSINDLNCIKQLFDNTFIGCGDVQIAPPVTAQQQNYLVKFDSLGNILWEKLWGYSQFQALREIFVCDTSSFLVMGMKGSFLTLQKFTMNGDSLWYKDYDFAPSSVRDAKAIVRNENSEFVVLFRLTDSTGVGTFPGILKLDSVGNYLSSHLFPDTTSDLTFPLSINQSADSNFTLISSKYSSLGSYTYVSILDKDYQPVSVHFYNTATAAVIVDSSSYYCTGIGINSYRANINGDTLWNILTSEPDARPADIIIDRKGCIISCGSIDDGSLIVSIGYVLKICDPIALSQSSEIEGKAKGIDIFPNPFVDFTEVRILNDSGVSHDSLSLVIYDVNGRVCRTSRIHNNKFIIEKGNLPSGFYTIQILSFNNVVYSNKIIIN